VKSIRQYLGIFGLRERRRAKQEYNLRIQKQSDAYRLGASQKAGDFSQILGTFSVLTQYNEVLLLSSTSAQSSLELVGINSDSIAFIEFKKDGASLSKGQKRLRDLVESGKVKVNYRVIDVKLPDGTNVKVRE